MVKKHAQRRQRIQLLGAIALNGYLPGFLKGELYQGASKGICFPILNCYSCPGALGACPIGSLQSVGNQGLSRYVVGMLVLFGLLAGRLFCGYACPFGFLQELLHKLPGRKFVIRGQRHKLLSRVKYFVLLVPVLLLPVLFANSFGMKTPYFCAYFCPAGTLEAGLPLMLAKASLRQVAGPLFAWKVGLLLGFVGVSILIYRFFCKYFCPLGALLGCFNPFSFYRLNWDADLCTKCGHCEKVCPMGVDPSVSPNHPDCIRCGDCLVGCPEGALGHSITKKREERQVDD